MGTIMRKVVGLLTAAVLISTVAPSGMEVRAQEQKDYYLSDLEWVSATHGDAYQEKTVQKDHPFTLGNNGQDAKISLTMPGGEIKSFDKGIGTVAASPSVITYNIEGAKVSKFHAYFGIDAGTGAQEGYANVEKIEAVVDDTVLYTTQEQYPNGISVRTEAIEVNLDIPENAKQFQLKSYAGEQTWGDEVVYADAKFTASGTFQKPGEWVPAQKRREISNEHPLMIIPLYAHGPKYERGEYGFWGDDTLTGKWETVPDDLKPYTVIELHPDDLPKREGTASDFYEHYLEEAQNYIDPKTGKNEPIPVVLTVFTAGNAAEYTATHWLTTEWIDQMYTKYSCLQGIFSTENYWVWTANLENMAAKYLELSAKHGGFFIWAEQNNGGSIERAFGSQGQTAFREAVEKYWQNLIFMYKNTPAAEGNDAPTSSYMTGLWLTDHTYQWGGLMDTWKWYETGKWKLFADGNIGKSQGNRQWLTEPEAMVGMEAMMIYLNGGCVYNFEHPAYTYGVRNEQSPLYANVIQEFFRYIVQNPAPSKQEILAKTKTLIHGNFSQMGNGEFFAGLITEMAQSPLYTTGRYGNIPAVPAVIDRSRVEQALESSSVQIVDGKDERLSTLEKKQQYLNELYPQEYAGDLFAQKLENRWYLYNSKYNENIKQTGTDMKLSLSNGKEVYADVTLDPHTSVILHGKDSKIEVRLNNYRTNKEKLWEGATNAEEAKKLPQMSKDEALTWVHEHYINHTKNGERRSSVIVLKEVEQTPVIENVTGLNGTYDMPQVQYDPQKKQAVITVNNNGYLYFDVNMTK